MNKVGIYCRLSEEDRDKASSEQDSESIQNQKNMLITYAMERTWKIVSIYSDDDYRGSDRNRPKWNELLKDAEQRKFDIVLCKSQSRFTRELEIVEKYIHGKFLEWNIRFVSVVDNADTSVRGNKKPRQINGLINEWYLEDLSENERAVFHSKQCKGEFIGTYAPYGYIKSPLDHNKLIIDEPAAEIVRMIFSLYVEGYGVSAISKQLNEKGILPPNEYKYYQGQTAKTIKTRNNSTSVWKDYTVRMILSRQTYIGDMIQGTVEKISYKSNKQRRKPKEEWITVPNTHEAIIERDIFYTVQNEMHKKARNPKGTGITHILAGKVFCSKCGTRMIRHTSKNTPYLECANKRRYTGNCDNLAVRLDELENRVLQELQKFTSQWDVETYLCHTLKVVELNNEKQKNFENRIAQLITKRDEQNRALTALYMDKVNSSISDSQFQAISSTLEESNQMLQKEIDFLSTQIEQQNNAHKQAVNIEQIVRKYTRVEYLNRPIVDELIDRIEVCVDGELNKHSKNKEIQAIVYWKF